MAQLSDTRVLVTGGRGNLLDASIMGPPIVWLASPDAVGVHDERIVARDFGQWLASREKRNL
jgi:gluconate 5-dehydrogenase